MKIILAMIFLLMIFPCTLSAQERKVLTVIGEYKFYVPPEKKHHEILDDSHLTILGFTVGKHSLLDVQGILGETGLLPRKEHAPDKICYVSDDDLDGTIVVFEAGPLGGWQYLTAFRVISNKTDFEHVDLCRKSTLVSKNIMTKSGIKLGMSRKELNSILGEPSKEIDNNFFYIYYFQRKMTDEELIYFGKNIQHLYIDVFSTVQATFLDSELIEISFSKVEST
jgi:hypothetical protein